MQEAFKLTDAEVEIIRALVEGKSVKEICEERKRSMETVRTQMRSILAKTETRSQSELIRITMSLMDVVGQSAAGYWRLDLAGQYQTTAHCVSDDGAAGQPAL